MDHRRFALEEQILRKHLPRHYAFEVNSSGVPERLILGFKTSSGRTYQAKLILDGYPYSQPKVYLTSPSYITDYDGILLSSHGVSASMHLLTPDGRCPQICHYKSDLWNANKSLWLVAMKVLVWLEAFQGHLSSGEPLDYYLKHQ